MSAFLCNERALLLKLVVQLCVDADGSHNKNFHKSFFDDAHSMIEQSEKLEIAFFQNRWHELGNTCSNSTATNEILTNPFVPRIAGYGIKNYLREFPISAFVAGIN